MTGQALRVLIVGSDPAYRQAMVECLKWDKSIAPQLGSDGLAALRGVAMAAAPSLVVAHYENGSRALEELPSRCCWSATRRIRT
jgi:hypothetical protein